MILTLSNPIAALAPLMLSYGAHMIVSRGGQTATGALPLDLLETSVLQTPHCPPLETIMWAPYDIVYYKVSLCETVSEKVVRHSLA